MPGPADYLIQILPWPAGQSAGLLAAVDITDDCTLEEFGSINRAVEGNFLAFRTGDLTFGAINDDGKFDDLFANLGATDRWQLRIFRRGKVIFLGIVLGQGSIAFDRKEKMVEITAYGATKVLDEASAEDVKRSIGDMTVTTATAGQAQITLNTTVGLLTGDVLHVTDQVNKEDVTVKQVTSGTVATLEANLQNTYAAASPVSCTTPFYRYKTPDFLVRALAAGVPIAELKISGSLFRRAAPTPINLGGAMDLLQAVKSGPAERSARRYQLMSGAASKSLYQPTPDADWTQEDTTNRPWVDWSPYFVQGTAEPGTALRCAHTPEADRSIDGFGVGWDPHTSGWDFISATKAQYAIYVQEPITPNTHLSKMTSADGTTWSAITNVATLPDTIVGAGGQASNAHSAEYDPVRNGVHCSYKGAANGGGNFQFYDIGGATFTDCKQADDVANTRYYGPRYIRDLDLTVALRESSGADKGPSFEICGFRGSARLWKRAFPNCLISNEVATASYVYPTQTMRYLNGILYAVVVSDGALQIIYSDDEFETYVMRKLADSTSSGRYFGARILDAYCAAGYSGSSPRTHIVGLPFYAGVVNYANFAGKTRAEALQDIAILVNATFWVDDDFQLHFVSRDQVPAGDIPDLTQRDLLLEQGEIQLWDQTRQHVEVSGGGFSARAGDPRFSADNVSITSELIPNAAYAQALADLWAEFLQQRRGMLPCTILDEQDLELFPMRRVIVDGRRMYVHESNDDPMNDEWALRLLEDLENQGS